MPRLNERSDGCYYIVGFHHDNFSTWQIDGEGVRYLAKKNIFAAGSAPGADGKFSREICFELLRRGLIYTDSTKERMEVRRQKWNSWRNKKDIRVPRPILKDEARSLLEEHIRIARTQGREALRKHLEREIEERKNPVQETESENN